MKEPEYYRGREQTYLKQFFLEKYLERVAYNIFSSSDNFIYVDGFSGPWKSQDENFEDTSFVIAINKLEEIRKGFLHRGQRKKFRCLFIEENKDAYRDLEKSVALYPDSEIITINGKFENNIAEIIHFIGKDFALVFIDPTGWTGFALGQISEILNNIRGELLINFMFDHINRHFTDSRPEQHSAFSNLLGRDDWYSLYTQYMGSGLSREETILKLYMDQLKTIGNFPLVTFTRILKPLAKRTYFYLIYATNHYKGLYEFREVERKFIGEQENIRNDAQQLERVSRTGQTELFEEIDLHDEGESVKVEKEKNILLAELQLKSMYNRSQIISYEEILENLLTIPLVFNHDIQKIIFNHRNNGSIKIEGMGPRERTLKFGKNHRIIVRQIK